VAVQLTVRGAVRQKERMAVRWAVHSVALEVDGSKVGTPSHERTTTAIDQRRSHGRAHLPEVLTTTSVGRAAHSWERMMRAE